MRYNLWKRTLAAALALSVVFGTAPAEQFAGMFVRTAVTASAEELSFTEAALSSGADGYYFNMPATGGKSLDLSGKTGGFSFTLYDDGGKTGNYSDSADGYLLVTAPAGCRVVVSGKISSEQNFDCLDAYDGDSADAAKLIDSVSSVTTGKWRTVTQAASTGSKMLIRFHSDSSTSCDGFELNVTLASTSVKHSVAVANAEEGGSITANKTTAAVSEQVSVTVTPPEGLALTGLVLTETGTGELLKNIPAYWYDNNVVTFAMPYADTTVTPVFGEAPGEYGVNIPAAGKLTANIPETVTSFRICDDGGANGKYSLGADGELTLNAPEGYVIKLTGRVWMLDQTDSLDIYDGVDSSCTPLASGIRSKSAGSTMILDTLISSGNALTLSLATNTSTAYPGVDLTAELVPADTAFNVLVKIPEVGGTLTIAKKAFNVGSVVTAEAVPDEGYICLGAKAVDGEGNTVAVSGGWASKNILTFRMPMSDVTIEPIFAKSADMFITMPVTGTAEYQFDGAVSEFSLYDDGGRDGVYSPNCSGCVLLTAPAGKVFAVSGSITTQQGADTMRIYDGSSTAGSVLNSVTTSSSNNTATDIGTLISSSNQILVCFNSNSSEQYDGLDLSVRLCDKSASYDITVADSANGTVTVADSAVIGKNVTITAKPDTGYVLQKLTLTDKNGKVTDLGCSWYTTQSASFTMPDSDLTVTPVFVKSQDRYVELSATQKLNVTIPDGITSFKVYDDGGKAGDYSADLSSYLTLTVPTGNLIRVSGTIASEADNDKLYFYDGTTTSSNKLIDSFTGSGKTAVALPIVTTSSNKGMFYFRTDSQNQFAGLDLTIELVPASTKHSISVGTASHGKVTVDKTTAAFGDTLTFTVTEDEGYTLKQLNAVDEFGQKFIIDSNGYWTKDNKFTYKMTSTDLTITPVFTNETGRFLLIPAKGITEITIPEGTESFMIYDDGGFDGDYSASCAGYLKLNGPEGYVFSVSGTAVTEESRDKLSLYKTSSASTADVVVSSEVSGEETAIDGYVSDNNTMKLRFSSNASVNYSGVVLKATLSKEDAKHSITVDSKITGGKVTTSLSAAKKGETVTVTATPSTNYELVSVSVNGVDIQPDKTGKYTFTMPGGDVVVSAKFGDARCFINSANVTLGSDIVLNFNCTIPASAVAGGAKAVFTGPRGSKLVDLDTLTRESDGSFKLSYPVSANQMGADIRLAVVDKSGSAVALYSASTGKKLSGQFSYSVNTCLRTLLGMELSAKEKALVEATYNYGAYAAQFFNNDQLPDDVYALPELTAADLKAYKPKTSGKLPSDMAIEGMTLVLDSTTSFRLYFTAAAKHVYKLDDKAVTPVAAGKKNRYYIELDSISAKNLTQSHTITVDDSFGIGFSALSYCYNVLSVSHDSQLCDLTKAVCRYAVTASSY